MTWRFAFVAALAATCPLLASCGRSADQERMDELSSEVDKINQEYNEQRRRQLAEEGFAEGTPEQAERLAAAMRAAGEETSPEQAMLLQAGASFTEELAAHGRAYYERVNAFMASGGYDPASLTSAEAINARRAMVDELDTANTAFLAKMDEMVLRHPAQVRSLAAKGVPQGAIDGYLAAFEASKPNLELARQIRRTDTDLCRHGREYLAVLGEHFGSWSLKPEGLEFAETVPDAALDRFNAAAEGLGAAAEEQADLQRRQLELTSP